MSSRLSVRIDDNELRLLLMLGMSAIPIPDNDYHSLCQEQSEHIVTLKRNMPEAWEEILRFCENLPPESAAWDQVDVFVAKVRRLAALKIAQRDAQRRLLQEAIQRIQKREDLSYFEADCVRSWSADHVDEKVAGSLAKEIDLLREDMDAYQALRRKKTATISEQRELDAQQDELEQRIIDRRDYLSGVLSLPPDGQPPTDKTTGPDLTEHEPADETFEVSIETGPSHEPLNLENDTLPWGEAEELAGSEPDIQQELEEVPEEGAPASVEEISALEELEGPSRETAVHDHAGIEAFERTQATLLSVADAARLWQFDQTVEAAEAFFWAILAHGDWSGAYWLARSMQARLQVSPLDPELLAVVVGASLVTADSTQMAQDLADLINHYDTQMLQGPGTLLALGAALRGTLVAPQAGFAFWLECPSFFPSLYELVNAVQEFANYQIPLRPSLLHGVADEAERRRQIDDAARRMQEYLLRAPQQTMSYQPATAIWREMVARNSPLHELMRLVSENRINSAHRVKEIVSEWSEREFVEREIDRRREKRKRIVASARQEIIRSTQQICELAHLWLGLVEQEQRIAREGQWLFQQIAALRKKVQATLNSVSTDLKRLASQDAALRACTLVFAQQLCDFLMALDLPADAFESRQVPPWQRGAVPSFAESDLHTALLRRLYWLPELTPERVYPRADTAEISSVIDALSRAYEEGRDTAQALELWFSKEDFRYVKHLLDILSDQDHQRALQSYQDALDDAREKLSQQIKQLEEEIEQAVVDGLISDDTRAEYLGQLESMVPQDIDEFPSRYAKLEEIRLAIEDARENRLNDLARRWQEESRRQVSLADPARWTYVERSFTEAFERRDSRAIEEYLDRVSSVGQMDEQEFQKIFGDTTATHSFLEEFVQKLEIVEQELNRDGLRALERAIREGKRFADYPLSNPSGPRQREALQAIEAWQRLKASGTRLEEGQLFQNLATLLKFLQFRLVLQRGSYQFKITERKADSIVIQSPMTVSEELVRPVPQFGSLAGGYYDVLCVWGRQSADTLGALLYDLKSEARSTILLYFGRITRQRRQQIARDRDKHLPVVILDETLLAFTVVKSLTQNPLRVFMQCALPYTGLSPYTPGQAGFVPPEIFFGRQDMVRQLQERETCTVFGGRQLGKSALLRHVQSRFHNPKEEQYAWVKDIKNVGDPAHRLRTDEIWPILRDGFAEMDLGRVRKDHEEEDIRQIMRENSKRRVIVLLDEADNFLEADASENFRIVDRLRVLMVDTQRRFKVVFAGLHNVQRFKNVPNQPLAHFGRALCVGPLEPTEALELVQLPLRTMGFQIDNTTALRILSHTNYHPGLIQLFCDELLKWLYRNPRVQIPYKIRREDVDAVYLRQNVRDGIRQRFEWTLALDPRYQVIAWSLIEDQTRDRDSYSRRYTSSDILRIARGWWPEGFEQVEIKSLLDEMVGLGVLIETEGMYRLRSPNLVRLIGETNVEQSLLQFAEFPPPQRRLDPDHHHALLNVEQDLYSPLTIAQEHLLNRDETGVGLLFGSPIAGAYRIGEVLQSFLPVGISENEGVCRELPLRLRDGEQLANAIERVLQECPEASHLILYYRLQAGAHGQQLVDQVAKAVESSERYKKRYHNRRIRLIFLLDSQAAWTWMGISSPDRERLEQRADAVISIAPWSKVGVRQWMDHREMITSGDILDYVYAVSGGWHSLLEDLFKSCPSQPGIDPREQTKELDERFETPDFRQAIWERLDLMSVPIAENVLRFLCQDNRLASAGVPASLVTPQFIDSLVGCSVQDCQRALALLERLNYISLEADVDGSDDYLVKVNPIILRVAL